MAEMPNHAFERLVARYRVRAVGVPVRCAAAARAADSLPKRER